MTIIQLDLRCERNKHKMTFDRYVKELDKEYKKRFTYPTPELSELELLILSAVAHGWTKYDLEPAIKTYAAEHNHKDSYNSISARLMNKFQAYTLAHAVYKAIKAGILDY